MKKFLAVMIAFMIATCGTVGAASELVSINGVTLSVKEAGHGEPMILLHGKGYSKEYMDSLFNYYAERYHVFSYDSRGHGKSDKPEAFTLEDDADDLAGLMTRLIRLLKGKRLRML